MIYCPKCKESLGDNITTCPFCFYEITDYERVLIAKEQREEDEKTLHEEILKAEEFSSLRTIWILHLLTASSLQSVICSTNSSILDDY